MMSDWNGRGGDSKNFAGVIGRLNRVEARRPIEGPAGPLFRGFHGFLVWAFAGKQS